MKADPHKKLIVDQFSKQAIPFSQIPGHAHALDQMLEMAMANHADTVLDVACGPGIVACAFAEKVKQVTGIDLTPAMITCAREHQQGKGLKNIAWEVGDVTRLPYPDNSFSLVLTRYSFHHFTKPQDVFAEMKRVCQKNGKVMVVDVALSPEKRAAYDRIEKLRDPSHTTVLTPAELLAMAEQLDLKSIRTQWYKVEGELETQIKASFPKPGDDEKIRAICRQDIGKDNLGIAVHRIGNEIHFAIPIMILVGKK